MLSLRCGCTGYVRVHRLLERGPPRCAIEAVDHRFIRAPPPPAAVAKGKWQDQAPAPSSRDDWCKARCLFDWKIGRPSTFQNSVGVCRCAAIHVADVEPEGHQGAHFRCEAGAITGTWNTRARSGSSARLLKNTPSGANTSASAPPRFAAWKALANPPMSVTVIICRFRASCRYLHLRCTVRVPDVQRGGRNRDSGSTRYGFACQFQELAPLCDRLV